MRQKNLLRMGARLLKPTQILVRPSDPDSFELRAQGRITIERDRWGRRAVRAEHESDLYLGFGFCQGRDRFFQADLFRRLATGRMAEFLGNQRLPPASGVLSRFEFIELDAFMRAAGAPESAAQAEATIDPHHLKLLEAFSRGMNQALDAMSGDLPPEYTLLPGPAPWTVQDSLAVGIFFGLAVDMAGLLVELNLDEIVARIGAEAADRLFPRAGIRDFLPAPTRRAPEPGPGRSRSPRSGPGRRRSGPGRASAAPLGSNAWVVSGAWTRSGLPMLCNDPHVPLAPIPNFWYPVALDLAGQYRAQGGSFVGFPALAFGHNERTAWGLTNVLRDAWDVVRFVEHPDDPTRYRDGDRWVSFETRLESIACRFRAPTAVQIRRCDRGFLLPGERSAEGLALGYRTIRANAAAMFRGYAALPRAHDWQNHRAGLREIHEGAAAWNALYADVDGHIAWKIVGQIPLRRKTNTVAPQAGWTDAGDWLGTIPFEETPEAVDPEEGILVSANHDACPPDYPHFISSYFEPPHRALRVQQLLKERPRGTHDFESMRRIQLDVEAPSLRAARDGLVAALRFDPPILRTEALAPAALAILEGWDLCFHRESAGAAIFMAFRFAWTHELLVPSLEEELAERWRETRPGIELLHRLLADPTDPWVAEAEQAAQRDRTSLIRGAFLSTLVELRRLLGPDPQAWSLGALQQIELNHSLGIYPGLGPALNIARIPVGGSDITINATFTCPGPSPLQRLGSVGPASRMIVDLGEPHGAHFANATGTSGDPASVHYADQTDIWRAGSFIRQSL